MNRSSLDALAARVISPGRGKAAGLSRLHLRRTPHWVTPIVAGIALWMVLLPVASPAADLPKDIRTSPDPDRAKIQVYVQSALKDLQSDDVKKATNARNDLIGNVGNNLTPDNGAFLGVYSSELASQLATVANAPAVKANVRLRLNMAIITAKVAEKTLDAGFAPLVAAELKDQNEGVVLWGLKGARFVIPAATNVPGLGKPLVTAVLEAPKRFLKSGEIISAAYDALTPDPATTPPAPFVGPVQDLLTWRVQQFQAGTPVEPSADSAGSAFLTTHAVWVAQKPQEQLRSLQIMVNLLAACCNDLPAVSPVEHDLLVRMMQYLGKGLQVVGYNINDQVYKDAVNDLASVKASTPAANIITAGNAAITATTAKWTTLTAPKPTTAATTSPAS